jgi:hypothetical protein
MHLTSNFWCQKLEAEHIFLKRSASHGAQKLEAEQKHFNSTSHGTPKLYA